MDSKIGQLQELLSKLPGIGPRQARRFVYFFLRAPSPIVDQIFYLITELRNSRKICAFCQKIHFQNNSLCEICTDKGRESDRVLIVAKNSDLENIEKGDVWNGRYFVLGRTLRVLEKDPGSVLNLQPLLSAIDTSDISEIVFGLPVNPEGEQTERFINEKLKPLLIEKNCTVSHMARGLSTGSELEYADPSTLKSALENRK